jgi:protein-tyrosine phosphatase
MKPYYVWILDDKLAVAPMPPISDIPELAKVFNGVVVLIEPHEAMGSIDYYLGTWRSNGVEVYYAPTPDFHPMDIIQLYRVVKWIDKMIRNGGRVLVHCMGGIGRSGLVAASYLLYHGWDPVKALTHVRSLRPGALEAIGQEIVFHDFHTLLGVIDEGFDKYLGILDRYASDKARHSSKTIQFMVELAEYTVERLEKELVYAGLLHCIPVEKIEELRDNGLIDGTVYTILRDYHDERDDRLPTLIRVCHVLDKYYDSRIVVTRTERYGDTLETILYYDYDPGDIVEEAYSLLNKMARYRVNVYAEPYENYM